MARYGYNYRTPNRGMENRYDWMDYGFRNEGWQNRGRADYRGGALEGYGGGPDWGPGETGFTDRYGVHLGEDRGYGARGGYGGGGAMYGAGRWGGEADYGGYGQGMDYSVRDWGTAGGRMGGMNRSTAADIMTENPEAVTGDTSLADAAKRMRDLDVGIIPVVESETDEVLRGVITDRDIAVRAAAEGKDMKKSKVSDFMSTDLATCHRNDDLRHVLNLMKRDQVRRIPVVDDENRLVGIIAQADLAVDYAGNFDVQREAEVEETIERISEPARPQWGGRREFQPGGRYVAGPRGDWRYGGSTDYDRDLRDQLREGWHSLKRGARQMLNRGYDQGWR